MDQLIWPGVVIILGMAGFLIFRQPLIALIDRSASLSIGKGGISVAPQQQLPTTVTVKDGLEDSKKLMELPFSEAIRYQESLLKDHLNKVHFKDQSEKEHLIIRVCARSITFSLFERLAFGIFGSQLELMITANSAAGGLDEAVVRKRFQEAQASDPQFHQQTTYDTYLTFLVSNNLLFRDGDRLKISVFGKDFLKYLVDVGLTHRRRG